MRVIEKKTGTQYNAKRSGDVYTITTLTGEYYKKLQESTFKRYFKPADTKKAEQTEQPTEQVNNQPKPKKHENEEAEPITTEKREHMIEKIKKMLALAENNPSLEEGLSAALQAQKLMVKYNIHEDEVTLEEIKDDITSLFSQQKHNSQLHSWRKLLASVVARNFRCKCYIQHQDVVFRGYKQDAEIALSVYLSLYTIGNSLGSKAYSYQKDTTGTGKGAYNSFVTGFLKGVEEGLDEQCTALMVITPKEVEEEWDEFSASFKQTNVSIHPSDSETFRKGYAEGKQAVKGRALTQKGGKK